jgi:hypothetical protein
VPHLRDRVEALVVSIGDPFVGSQAARHCSGVAPSSDGSNSPPRLNDMISALIAFLEPDSRMLHAVGLPLTLADSA